MISTADVKPIDDVITECRAWLLSKGGGTRERRALGAAFGEACRVIWEARGVVEESSGGDEYSRFRRFQAHGEVYAASKVIRAIADEIEVSNFR